MKKSGVILGLNQAEQHVVELVREYQAGHTEAYDRIYSLTYPKVYYWILTMVRDEYEAQDVAQEAYVSIYQNLGKLEDPQAYKKWSNQIIYHCTLDYLNSKRCKSTQGSDIDSIAESEIEEEAFTDSGASILAAERRNAVLDAINELNPMLKATVMLRFYDDLKEREIAEIMSVPLGTVKRRLMIAKQQLSGKLTGVYSLCPFFFVRLAVSKQMGFTARRHGAHIAEKPFRKAAVCAGITAGATASLVLQGPEIRSVRYYPLGTYVNEQRIEWDVKSPLPVKSASISGLPGAVEIRGNHFSAAVPDNGTYTILVTDAGGRTDSQTVKIDNVDNEPPVYLSYEENGGSMILKFEDQAGVSWSACTFQSENGSAVPAEINPDSGQVRIETAAFPVKAKMEDLAGNYAYYDLHVNSVRLGSAMTDDAEGGRDEAAD